MFRLSGLVSIVIASLLGGALFWTSQSVQRTQGDLSEKRQMHAHEEESLRVLTSEWSYLNRPDRIEELIVRGEDLDEMPHDAAAVLQDVSAVPEPMIPAVPMMKPLYVGGLGSKAGSNVEAPKTKIIQSREKDAFGDMLNAVTQDAGGVQ